MPEKPVKIVAVQASPDKEETVESNLKLLDEAAKGKPDDIAICYNRKSTT